MKPHPIRHGVLVALLALIPISLPVQVAATQLPEDGEIPEVPSLFPTPGEDGSPILPLQTMELTDVTDIVWASILETEKQDPIIADLLQDVPVLISGILEIHGKDQLYLGIGRSYHAWHGIDHIKATLHKRFPGVPIYVEPSDGVQRQTGPPPDTLFADDFQAGLGRWTTSAFFSTTAGWETLLGADDNIVVQTQGCPWNLLADDRGDAGPVGLRLGFPVL